MLVGWDTLDVPIYSHRAFAAYQSDVNLTPSCAINLTCCRTSLLRAALSARNLGISVPSSHAGARTAVQPDLPPRTVGKSGLVTDTS